MTIYYRIVTVWCKWPFNDEVEDRYIEFSKSKNKFEPIEGLRMKTGLPPSEKVKYLHKYFNRKVTVEKTT